MNGRWFVTVGTGELWRLISYFIGVNSQLYRLRNHDLWLSWAGNMNDEFRLFDQNDHKNRKLSSVVGSDENSRPQGYVDEPIR